MTDFIETTIDGRQHLGQSENAPLENLVDQLSSKGHFELVVVSADALRDHHYLYLSIG
ncbi:hypothetical protein HNQ71_004231 [Mesorhizobium sangaii]|uniref:Uncharacterized protein n=1 Tax=Mesorhizobium sangaii TaxID=505389 RepID=A0A841PDA2_9HYPH|nr:hypothetical protein [Mesorhizobium sangaii]